MKKQIACLLILLMLILLPVLGMEANAAETVASGTCGENVAWTLDDVGTLTISGTGAMGDYASASDVPWYANCTLIQAVVIEEGVTRIGKYAFYNCNCLTSVIIPDSVNTIGDYAFYNCNSLTDVYITDIAAWVNISLDSTYSSPLRANSLDKKLCLDGKLITDLVIPEGVAEIGNDAFYHCSSLTSVTIPDSVTSIGYYAFCGCGSLTSLTIPDSVTSINGWAFDGCSSLTGVYVDANNPSYCNDEHGVLFNKDKIALLWAPNGINDGYQIPEGVASIEDSAFSGCYNLSSIAIPDSVTTIGMYVFSNCSSLTNITIGEGVIIMGAGAFSDCNCLTGIYVDANNSEYSSDEYGVLFNKDKTALLQAPSGISGSYQIPKGVTCISSYAFENCSSLKSITIPGSVTSIGYDAFCNCSGLTSATIGEGVTSIGSSVFKNCSSLTSITIPEGVTSIGDDAFYNCSSLKSITIPDSVTSIGSSAFSGCDSLTDVYITDIVAWLNISFATSSANPLRVNNLDKKWYLNGELITDLVIPEGITSIGSFAFENYSSLKSITIPDSVTSIGYDAFSGCDSLTDVYITDIVAWLNISFATSSANPLWANNLDKKWYINGELITDLVIPEGVASIGNYVFSGCNSLTSVTIPVSVTNIGSYAFEKCRSLTKIDVGANNPCYSSDAYGVLFNKDKTTLLQAPGGICGSYQIPDSVTSIDERAFSGCSNLTGVTIPESVTSIGWFVFSGCGSLTSIAIPDSITDIGDGTFCGCSSLSDITIPGSITQIRSHTFYGCSNLTSVTIGEGVTYIYGTAFWDCGSLTSITIPDSVTGIGVLAFENCSSLTTVHYGGTIEQKADLICDGNQEIKEATWHYQCDGVTCKSTNPEEPSEPEETDPAEPIPAENPFVDVFQEDYYYNSVLWAVKENITNGMDDTHFAPGDTCTRGQIVTFLWRSCGSPEPKNKANPFCDVTESDYFYNAVLWAVENGITSGMGEGVFAPAEPCTRGQVATFLWRSEKQPTVTALSSFLDVASDAYYYNAVLWAVAGGVTNGMGDGIFAPDAPCTRGQIVTFLYRAEGFDRVEAPITIQYTHNLVDRSYYNPAGLLRILYTYNKVEVLGQTQAAKEINARIGQDVDVFFSRLTQEDLEEYASRPWLEAGDYFWYTAESEVTNNSGGVFSICVATDWMMGGVHNLDYHGLNFDMNTGKEIDLATLLEMDEAGLTEKLKDIAWAYLIQYHQDALFEDAYETLYGYSYDDFLYYFRNNQLILTFPTYALGYGASGAFTVPTGLYI